MQHVTATYQNGRIVFDGEVDWPDGTRVTVLPDDTEGECRPGVRKAFFEAVNAGSEHGLDESWWPLSQEENELLWESAAAAEPLEITEEELDRWERERQQDRELQKEFTKQSWEELKGLFE